MTMPSSLWTDETATALVARFPNHPSFAIASPYTQSIYYVLPRVMDRMFGFSEIGYRIPSVIAMAIALWFLARLVSRLISPDAGWFAVFACFAYSQINYFAIDAKPYALGMCIALAALLFEVRWLDSGRFRDAIPFLITSALLLRVHQVYWPFYLVLAFYALIRLILRDTTVGFPQLAAVFTLVVIALIPPVMDALRLYHEAAMHAFVSPPKFGDLKRLLSPEWSLISVAGAIGWLIGKFSGRVPDRLPSRSNAVLVGLLWLVTPVTIFVFSQWSNTSLFVPRYLSLHLPGAVLAATLAAGLYVPRSYWRPLSLAMGIGALLSVGQWNTAWPDHDPARWRDAAAYVNRISSGPEMPALCTSPFVEAVPPVWRPDYRLPGFLYAQLFAYPLRAKPFLLPFRQSQDVFDYAGIVAASVLAKQPRFVIYGGIGSVIEWSDWMRERPEFRGWQTETHDFGEIRVEVFHRPRST